MTESIRISATAPNTVTDAKIWLGELMDWFGQHGGRPDVLGQMFPPGVRLAVHPNDVIAELYKVARVLVLEFDDANLAMLFKLRFGGTVQ